MSDHETKIKRAIESLQSNNASNCKYYADYTSYKLVVETKPITALFIEVGGETNFYMWNHGYSWNNKKERNILDDEVIGFAFHPRYISTFKTTFGLLSLGEQKSIKQQRSSQLEEILPHPAKDQPTVNYVNNSLSSKFFI